MPMKPKTKVMATATMLSITIGFGALFVYIEEKKFEAMGYKNQLSELEQQLISNKQGYQHLMKALAVNNDALAKLLKSPQLDQLSQEHAEEIAAILSRTSTGQSHALLQSKFSLTEDEIRALQSLSQNVITP